jgi:hypothetical protein
LGALLHFESSVFAEVRLWYHLINCSFAAAIQRAEVHVMFHATEYLCSQRFLCALLWACSLLLLYYLCVPSRVTVICSHSSLCSYSATWRTSTWSCFVSFNSLQVFSDLSKCNVPRNRISVFSALLVCTAMSLFSSSLVLLECAFSCHCHFRVSAARPDVQVHDPRDRIPVFSVLLGGTVSLWACSHRWSSLLVSLD